MARAIGALPSFSVFCSLVTLHQICFLTMPLMSGFECSLVIMLEVQSTIDAKKNSNAEHVGLVLQVEMVVFQKVQYGQCISRQSPTP